MTDSPHQETGKTWTLKMQGEYRRDGHGFSHEYRDPSPSEITEAARNLPGAKEVVVRQNRLGESVIHMAGNPLADAAINLRSGHYLVLPIEGTE